MDESGLVGIDLDAVNRRNGEILTVAQLDKWWRYFCDTLRIEYTNPHCITAGGKGYAGLHYYFTLQPGQTVTGAKLRELPVELRDLTRLRSIR